MSDIHAKMIWFMILAIFLLIKNLLHANFSSFELLTFVVRGLPRPANQFNDRTAQGSSLKGWNLLVLTEDWIGWFPFLKDWKLLMLIDYVNYIEYKNLDDLILDFGRDANIIKWQWPFNYQR